MYFRVPETRRYTIEEVSRLFDGKDVAEEVAAHAGASETEDRFALKEEEDERKNVHSHVERA